MSNTPKDAGSSVSEDACCGCGRFYYISTGEPLAMKGRPVNERGWDFCKSCVRKSWGASSEAA